MELEETQFTKNQVNDVLSRGTKKENVSLVIMRIFTLVAAYITLERLVIYPKELGFWYNAFVIFILGYPVYKMLFWGEMAERKKCIKKGQKFAAKLIDVEVGISIDMGREYKDYISRFQCLENSKEYIVHFDNFDIRKYIANPYCNLYVYQKKKKCIVAVKDFCIKPEHLSKSGYFLVK